MRLAQVIFGAAEQRGGAMQMPLTFARAPNLDAMENLGLQCRSEPLHALDLVGARGLLKLGKRADAERFVEPQHLVGPQARDGQQLKDTGWKLLPHGLKSGMGAGLVQCGDHAGYGIADSGDFAHAALPDELVQRNGNCAKALGRAGIGPHAVRIAAAQSAALREFTKQFSDG